MTTNRPYEALTILKSAGTEADLAQSVKQIEESIQKLGGRIDSSASWGRRRLAYRIARQSEGVYHLVQFHVAPDQLDELKRLFRLNEHIVRFLVLNRDNHREARGPAPAAAAAKAPERSPRAPG